MTDLSALPLGSSCSFFRHIDREIMETAQNVGIDTLELSFKFDKYMNELEFPRRAAEIGRMAREVGIGLWSLHLPFSRNIDISTTNKELRAVTLYTNRTLIRAAAEAGISTIVLHPSSEPIADEERAERMELSRDAILSLGGLCRELGLTLAIENLPRTCLCRTSAEMIELLAGTGAKVCFDTNHSLSESNPDFLRNLLTAGLEIATLHISDYDGIDERHRLPGDGINAWGEILAIWAEANYNGPLMYEVSRKPKEREELTPEELAENMHRFAAGEIR